MHTHITTLHKTIFKYVNTSGENFDFKKVSCRFYKLTRGNPQQATLRLDLRPRPPPSFTTPPRPTSYTLYLRGYLW